MTRRYGEAFLARVSWSVGFLAAFLVLGGQVPRTKAGPMNDRKSYSITILTDRDEDKKGWLGVWLNDVTRSLKRRYDLRADAGAFVVDVVEDSPADKAGLRKHDVIVSINGQPVSDADDVTRYLEDSRPGENVTLEVLRGDKRLTLTAELGERPEHAESFVFRLPGISISAGIIHEMLGIEPQDLNRDLAKYFRLKEPKGVLVAEVEEDGPADRAGVKAGDVILAVEDEEVWDKDDLRDVLSDYDPGDRVTLTIWREGEKKQVEVKLGGKGRTYHYRLEIPRTPTPPFWFEWQEFAPTLREDLRSQIEEYERELRKQLREEQRELVRRELRKLERELERLSKELEELRSEIKKLRESK